MNTICLTCEKARKPWSDELAKQGYVGCCMFVIQSRITKEDDNEERDISFLLKAKEAAEGWVDLRSRPNGKGSGIVTNFQLLTLEVEDCKEYQQISE